MIIKFRGIDQRKKFSTISVLNREGEEIYFYLRCYDLKDMWNYAMDVYKRRMFSMDE